MQHRLLALIASILTAVMGAVSVPEACTTRSFTAAFGYDAPTIVRVDEHDAGAVDAGTAHLSGDQERSASPSLEIRGPSTTSAFTFVATEAAGLADDAAGSYGPFHRLESPTQTPATAALQEANGEVWRATARGGLNPAVKAYRGPLPPGARGGRVHDSRPAFGCRTGPPRRRCDLASWFSRRHRRR
jgi:hypothetical protein